MFEKDSSSALVSCLMVTKGTPERLPGLSTAIACFKRQTYSPVELVIVTDTKDPNAPDRVEALVNSIDAPLVRLDTRIAVGQTILELTVDLSDQFPHDCPPVSYYRLCACEAAWLRRLSIAAGEKVPVGALLARFSKTPDEAVENRAGRPLRTTIVGVTPQTQGSRAIVRWMTGVH